MEPIAKYVQSLTVACPPPLSKRSLTNSPNLNEVNQDLFKGPSKLVFSHRLLFETPPFVLSPNFTANLKLRHATRL